MTPHSKYYFLSFFLFSLIFCVNGQESATVDSLVQVINQQFGIEKLKSLNRLSAYYEGKDRRKSLKYGRQAEQLAESIFTSENVLLNPNDRKEKLKAHYHLGKIQYDSKKYLQAKQSLEKAYQEASLLKDTALIDQTNKLLAEITEKEKGKGFFGKQLKPLNLSEKINKGSTNLKLSSILVLAKKYEQLKQYDKAIEQYKMAVNLSRNKGDAQKIAELHSKIAELYQLIEEPEAAVAYYQIASGNFEKLKDTTSLQKTKKTLGQLLQSSIASNDIPDETLDGKTEEEVKETINRFQELSKKYERQKDFDQSFKYFKKYIDIQNKFNDRKRQQEIDSIQLMNQSQEIMLLEQENELNDIEIIQREKELERQASFRNGLLIGVSILLLLSILFWWLFKTKKKAHKDLTIIYDHLNNTRKQLANAEQKIKKMLGQQVSEDIATALISDEADKGTIQKYVCIMFLDIRDFTPFASTRSPEEVIAYQNDVFGFMIEIIAEHKGVINQFMGDGFMATFGAPVSYQNDVFNAFQAAKAIVAEVNKRSSDGSIPYTKIGIGMHAGNVVAGNVGTEVRKQYSITGTTVITAARIEQLNKKYASQLLISESVANKLNGEMPAAAEVYEEQLKGMDHQIKIYKIE